MRNLFVLLTIFVLSNSLHAQNWEALPSLQFEAPLYKGPLNMYYDSIDDVSYIVGKFDSVNHIRCNVVKWDGSSAILLPVCPSQVNSSVVRYNNKIYVGGRSLAVWDGSNWTDVPISSQGIIEDLYVYNNKLYVTGLFSSIAGQPIGKIAVWNDTTWSDLGRADTALLNNDQPYTFTHYKGNFYVAGNFGTLTSVINEIAMFDGQQWKDVGNFPLSGMGEVSKLLVWNDTLYASGMFSQPGNSIAKWDGTNWHKLNNGVEQQGGALISDLMVYNNELYACGSFDNMDDINLGIGYKGLAKWDGSRWCWLGTVADNLLYQFGQFRDELYIMGGFSNINGIPAQKIARWTGGNYTDTCSEPQELSMPSVHNPMANISLYPNPVQHQLQLNNLPPGTHIRITDILGRTLYTSTTQSNHLTINTKPWQTGIYLVQMRNNANQQRVEKIWKE